MWSYYGAKTNIIDLYPPPKYSTIIEPFAGTARYALKYFDRDIVLVDKYEVIIKIWRWLQLCSAGDILSLPRKLKVDQTLNDFSFDCDEAKMLMGFLIKKGVERPSIKPSTRVTVQRPNFINFSLQRIASNLPKIRHWQIIQGDYCSIQNKAATWFIDPPYQFGGGAYVMSSKKINFQNLSTWCKEREGQVVVCENTKADWMKFAPLKEQRGSRYTTVEAIWTNYENSITSHFQTSIF